MTWWALLFLVGIVFAYLAGYARGHRVRVEDLADTIKMVRREMKNDQYRRP